jgi:hypothetical protein
MHEMRRATNPGNKPRSAVAAEPRISIDNEPVPSSAITMPLVDWQLEAETVAHNIANAKLYRDLAGFTREQLEWMKRIDILLRLKAEDSCGAMHERAHP